MTKTGQKFEMNPETFTLDNVFAMELHRFQDTIGEIVNCAVKELAIERVREKLIPLSYASPRSLILDVWLELNDFHLFYDPLS